jgi:nicotinamide-nucleotide amidase
MSDLSPLVPLAAEIISAAKAVGLMIATAESCTAGLIVGTLTEIAGSSAVVERGFVTYSNEAKTEMLGVPAELIARVGAVSHEVAIAMAAGALARSRADLSVSVTGIAGPGGGSADKPVGLVHFGAARRFGDIGRSEVRLATVQEALTMLREMI